jgi:hypothetical protein
MKLKSPHFVLIFEIVLICFFHAIKLNNSKPLPVDQNIQSSLEKTQLYFERYTMAILKSISPST